ncbi:hypothetical protein Hanom_Chr15g01390361 [Helianthus anomalus]
MKFPYQLQEICLEFLKQSPVRKVKLAKLFLHCTRLAAADVENQNRGSKHHNVRRFAGLDHRPHPPLHLAPPLTHHNQPLTTVCPPPLNPPLVSLCFTSPLFSPLIRRCFPEFSPSLP